MKKFAYILIILLLPALMFSACDDMLGVESDRMTPEDEYRLAVPSDSVYSMFGLLTQLQKIADSYVILGELRADLMDVTEKSEPELRQINALDFNRDNRFANIKDYYAVINNCNYIIQHLDTSYVDKGQKLKLRQYASTMSIRAWTYMQIALNFGKVKYFEKPILNVDDAGAEFPEYTMEELAPKLIEGLEPVKTSGLISLGFLENYNASFSMFPVRFVLGDLYLWLASFHNDMAYYEKAATEYRQLMYDRRVVVEGQNQSTWTSVNNTISSNATLYWQRAFLFSSGEVITTITCPTKYGQTFLLDTLNNQRHITASNIALSNWDNQTYFMNEASNNSGDLRKFGSISYSPATNKDVTTDYSFKGVTEPEFLIYKYKIYKQNVIVYRSSLLYLRYAEAVNRMGKPNLAFAVLKYGLNSTTMFNDKIIPQKERGDGLVPTYMSFTDTRFSNNVGIRMRGLGNVDKDTASYRIQNLPNQADSVLYVENLIQEELALETAFEGNRFHDLMRFAIRRNDNAYLADKVSSKHATGSVSIRTKLMDRNNWYVR